MQVFPEIDETRTMSTETYTLKQRNLGAEILRGAIEDYRGADQQKHESAALFLYPQAAEYQQHFEWAVNLASNVGRSWVRDRLDKCRTQWDEERSVRMCGRRMVPRHVAKGMGL